MIPQSRIETARKALDMITDRMFWYELALLKDDDIVDSSEECFELTLTKKQLWYLISEKSLQKRVFEDLDMEKLDTDKMFEEMAKVEFFYVSKKNENCDDDNDDDGIEYTGYIQGIDSYVDKWVDLLNKIIIGFVVDSNLTEWVEKIENQMYY